MLGLTVSWLNPFTTSKMRSGDRKCDENLENRVVWGIYTVNHKKRDILFLTITLDNLNRFL